MWPDCSRLHARSGRRNAEHLTSLDQGAKIVEKLGHVESSNYPMIGRNAKSRVRAPCDGAISVGIGPLLKTRNGENRSPAQRLPVP